MATRCSPGESVAAEAGDPVTGDLVAPGEPHASLRDHVGERALETDDAGGPADHPRVETDGEQLRMRRALPPEPVERVADVLREVAPRHEALRVLVEVHVVRVEGVRDH